MADPTTMDGPSGLRYFLRSIETKTGSPATLCIILAGTNDLGFPGCDATTILGDIQTLHEASHEAGVPTIAVGIPPSAWQKSNADAARMAADINRALREWCESSAGSMATFVSFPIDASTVGNDLWCYDGLHFSPSGFRVLGEGLAPSVAKVVGSLVEST